MQVLTSIYLTTYEMLMLEDHIPCHNMASLAPTEDESFIILGTSPGTSLDLKCDGLESGNHSFQSIQLDDALKSLDKAQLDDALKDLSAEASMALKAHLKLSDSPSPASLMAASTIITDDRTTEELQKSFGEILDENTVLKETLMKNNESMKEQFLLIASCQEDMMKTHLIHKEKFDETKELVEKLRQENKKLKHDIVRLVESETSRSLQQSVEGAELQKSGPSSVVEFVTSPDDDTINKLTAQLELVEKQRRQVIVDNEKLMWQKESLEHLLDVSTKERDDLKEKIKNLELQNSSIESEYGAKISLLNATIEDLNKQIFASIDANSKAKIDPEELSYYKDKMKQFEENMAGLQNRLRDSQLKILELESIKLEYTKQKAGFSDTVKMYNDQILELTNRLKEAQTIMFQPVRLSLSEDDSPVASDPEYGSFNTNVKLYDQTLKHLANLLNSNTNGTIDSLVETLGTVASLHDYKLDRTTVEQFKAGLAEVRRQLEKQHTNALNNVGQARNAQTIFEGIFKDYLQLVKKSLNNDNRAVCAPNVEALTSALVARGQEIQNLKSEIAAMKNDVEQKELFKAQMDVYKSDFDAEREAREKMASERDRMYSTLKETQKHNQEILLELNRLKNPTQMSGGGSSAPRRTPQPYGSSAAPTTTRRTSPGNGNATTGNMVYKCPKCLKFSSDQYKVMEDHFDFCLDDF